MIVFFFRKVNDLDHLTPVIARIANDDRPVLVLCLSPRYDLSRDYRARFLAGLPGVTIAHQFAWHAPTLRHRFLARLLCGRCTFRRPDEATSAGQRVWCWLGRGAFLGLVAPWFDRKYRWLLRFIYHDRWAEDLLRRARASVAVFDWAKPYQHNVGSLQRAAGRLGVPTVALPHGVDVFLGDFRGVTARKKRQVPNYGSQLLFDHIVVPHEEQADYYVRCRVPREKLHVLGSARFSNEWVRRNLEISPPLSFPGRERRPGELRIVLMDKPTANLDGPVGEAVAALAALPETQLVIRPATRNDATTLAKVPASVRVSRDSSARLVEWADVVIGTTSSIVIEPLMQGKPLICPLYFSKLRTVFTETGACITVNSTQELIAALEGLRRGERIGPPREVVESLLDRLVRNGRRDRQVLDDYANFLERIPRMAPVDRPRQAATA